jgi:hypothetical protein
MRNCSGSANETDTGYEEIDTAPMTDDADTSKFLNSVRFDQSHHSIGCTPKLRVIMELNDQLRVVAIVANLMGPSR